MKVRKGFISNSSSCSFIIGCKQANLRKIFSSENEFLNIICKELISYIKNIIDDPDQVLNSEKDCVKYFTKMFNYNTTDQFLDSTDSNYSPFIECLNKIDKGYKIFIYRVRNDTEWGIESMIFDLIQNNIDEVLVDKDGFFIIGI